MRSGQPDLAGAARPDEEAGDAMRSEKLNEPSFLSSTRPVKPSSAISWKRHSPAKSDQVSKFT